MHACVSLLRMRILSVILRLKSKKTKWSGRGLTGRTGSSALDSVLLVHALKIVIIITVVKYVQYYPFDLSTAIFSYSHTMQHHTVLHWPWDYPSNHDVLYLELMHLNSELLGTLWEMRHDAAVIMDIKHRGSHFHPPSVTEN